MDEETETAFARVLESWNALQPSRIGFTLVYTHFKELSEKNAESTVVREDLTEWCSPKRCLSLMLQTYPSQKFTVEQVTRCTHIFRQIVMNCTLIEMKSDAQVEFGFEDYYSPGYFTNLRSKVLQDLFNAPEIVVLCFDVGKDNNGPNFTLLQLLTEDEAHESFLRAWESLPSYDFSTYDNIKDLDVNISRVNRAMEETKKLNDELLSGMQSMTDGFKGYSDALQNKAHLIAEAVIKKQTERIENTEAILLQTQKEVLSLKTMLDGALDREDQAWTECKKAKKKAKKARKQLKKTKKKLPKIKGFIIGPRYLK